MGGGEKGEWKRNEKQEQNKARGKINASLQAGGSCGGDEYLPGSGLMILEMFSNYYWVLVGLFSENKKNTLSSVIKSLKEEGAQAPSPLAHPVVK